MDILVASPKPHKVNMDELMVNVPIGQKTARSVAGGMIIQGFCVTQFALESDQIVVANAVITMFIDH